MSTIPLSTILELYQGAGLPASAVARSLGVTRQAISDRLKKAGVPIRPAYSGRPKLTKKLLVDLYVTKGLSTEQIGNTYGYSGRWVRIQMKKHGVEWRTTTAGRPRKFPQIQRLRIGQSIELPTADWKFPNSRYYPMAKAAGIKISAKVLGNGMMRITRKS